MMSESETWKRLETMRPFRSFWPGAVSIVLLTLLAYSSVFNAGFIWDDDSYVTSNPQLNSLDGLANIWLNPGATPQYYPMTFTVLWVQKHLWGLNPLGFHLVNIFLHAAAAILFWLSVSRLGIPSAFWAACIFAVHPVHVESVAWITELKNVLSAFFYFLAFLSYGRFSEISSSQSAGPVKTWSFYTLSLVCFLFALFSKTVSGSLPAAILLILWWKQGKFPRRDTLLLMPFFIAAFVLGRQTATLEVNQVGASGQEWQFTVVDRILIAGRAVWFYLTKLFWPHPLIFNYPRWHIDSSQWWQYLFPAGVLLLVSCLWMTRRRTGQGPLVAVLFFLGTLFPALGFFNVFPMLYSFVADHFQYLASTGVIVLFCAAAGQIFHENGLLRRRSEYLFYGTLILFLSVLTWQQGRTYLDRETLYTDVITKNPGSWMAYNNRGEEYRKEGQLERAMKDYNAAIALNPSLAKPYANRGILYDLAGEPRAAVADFDRAIALDPVYADAYTSRGYTLMELNELDRAIADFDTAIALDPSGGDAYLNRGVAFTRIGRPDLAIRDYDRAIAIMPSDVLAYTNRAMAFRSIGKTDEAIRDYTRVLSIKPDSSDVYMRRGDLYRDSGDAASARGDYEKACGLGNEAGCSAAHAFR